MSIVTDYKSELTNSITLTEGTAEQNDKEIKSCSLTELKEEIKGFLEKENDYQNDLDGFYAKGAEFVEKVLSFFCEGCPELQYIDYQREAFIGAYQDLVKDFQNDDRHFDYYTKSLNELTEALAKQQKLYLKLTGRSPTTIFTIPSFCDIDFLKTFLELHEKVPSCVEVQFYYNLEVEVTEMIRKYEKALENYDKEKMSTLQNSEEMSVLLKKLKLILSKHPNINERYLEKLYYGCVFAGFAMTACDRGQRWFDQSKSHSSVTKSLLNFVSGESKETPLQILKDFIQFEQMESDSDLKEAIRFGLCYRMVDDDKTLVRHWKA